MHPTESILNDIKDRITNNVQNIKSVLWIDAKVSLNDFPVLVISSAGETIRNYHNIYYIVDLDVELKFLSIDSGFNRHTQAILTAMNDVDLIIKSVTDRSNLIMTVDNVAGSNLSDSENLENNILVSSRIYRIKYKRTRGLN